METAVAPDPHVTMGNCIVRLIKGDITELEVDAFVFYAQPELALGSGFGGMIAVRGGGLHPEGIGRDGAGSLSGGGGFQRW